MLGNLSGWHALIILVVVLLLFGAPRLPALARSLGQSMRILKSESKANNADKHDADSTDSANESVSRVEPVSRPEPVQSAEANDTKPKP